MKLFTLGSAMLIVLTTCFLSCKPTKEEATAPIPEYVVNVTQVTQQNAPALQSYAHGVNGADWLLFAGRTNRINDDGGLHDLNANYSNTSFLPLSYNEDIFVYNVDTDVVSALSFNEMVSEISSFTPEKGSIDSTAIVALLPKVVAALKANGTVFRSTNPLVMQENDYMYLAGGYGTPLDQTDNGNAYQTFNQVARINVPSMIKVINSDLKSLTLTDWQNLVAFGSNDKLVSTGGEMFKIGNTFYLAGGHNFGSTAPAASQGQQYLDAVYPFTMSVSASNPLALDITVSAPITDVPTTIGTPAADATSKFRRRDGPIVSALYMDSNKNLTEGLAFYGGVFQPDSVVTLNIKNKEGKDSTVSYLRAWNTAIYVTPSLATNYTIDASYNQKNFNVYACADFELYDKASGTVSTFLMGGIGDGTYQGPQTLSPFTNSLTQVRYDLNTGKSSPKVIDQNIFGSSSFYGAETEFIFNSNQPISFMTVNGDATEVIDADNTFEEGKGFDLGYIYGGIEAFENTPGTFGRGKSAASSKIWKVTVTKNTVNN
tara:strand:+ start:784 stop:2415 length:1632 start_codon:yes stop_codon:yes gene_type:complete